MENEKAVTGIFQTGKLLAVGPLTTTAGMSRVVETLVPLRKDRHACTCELCGIDHTQNQTIQASHPEGGIEAVHHGGR